MLQITSLRCSWYAHFDHKEAYNSHVDKNKEQYLFSKGHIPPVTTDERRQYIIMMGGQNGWCPYNPNYHVLIF